MRWSLLGPLVAGTPLRAEPGGAVVAYLVEPARSADWGTLGSAFDAIPRFPQLNILDKKPGWVHIAIAGERTAVVGWIPASAIAKEQAYGVAGMLSGMGTGGGNIRCQRDVPLFMRSVGKLYDLGTLRAHADIAGERAPGGAIRVRLDPAAAVSALLGAEPTHAADPSADDGPFVPDDQAQWCTTNVSR